MPEILKWDNVSDTGLSFRYRNAECSFIIYKLESLPNFRDHTFDYLCKEEDSRQSEIVRRQITMLNYIHSIAGANWSVSLRFIKKDNRITLYIVFRHAGEYKLSRSELEAADRKIQNALMNEYSFVRVHDEMHDEINEALNISWASQVSGITKYEEVYSEEYEYFRPLSKNFYVPYIWNQTDNDMENICTALMRSKSRAAVEITIVRAEYLEAERGWISENIRELKNYMNGYIPQDENGIIINDKTKKPYPRLEPKPELKMPLDNFEKALKLCHSGRTFLASLRVWSDENAEFLANAFVINSVRGKAEINTFTKTGEPEIFAEIQNAYMNADLYVKILSDSMCEMNERDNVYTLQRLNRLNSVEEISNFFRIPVPVKSNFPGFFYDTGAGTLRNKDKEHDSESSITLGTYSENNFDCTSAKLNVQNLARHGLIVGVPGSGKTTAMFSILSQLWKKHIPFIVLEPAKTEYRALKTLDMFKDDMIVFTAGDESISPFRFNPFEVPEGIRLETHISKLQACFTGAFNLFPPLPILLEKALHRTYEINQWYEDSIGGEHGPVTPSLSDLCRNAEIVASETEYAGESKSNIRTALIERLNSLCRGSKGFMLNTKKSIPVEDLMNRPVILELDSLNSNEKSLVMMFLLSYVYEHCKATRKSGVPLQHMLIVEEAHNLIGSSVSRSDERDDPSARAIELFVNMLAEMRALGEGIMIADQLPTAITPQAVKQTNLKILMRITAKDDREEIGSSMNLDEHQMHNVINFKTGDAFIFHEEEDRVRKVRMPDFKKEHKLDEPPSDNEICMAMNNYQESRPEVFMPFTECMKVCRLCSRRSRKHAEDFVRMNLPEDGKDIYDVMHKVNAEHFRLKGMKTAGMSWRKLAKEEAVRINHTYGRVPENLCACIFIHLWNSPEDKTRLHKEDFDLNLMKFTKTDIHMEAMKNAGSKI